MRAISLTVSIMVASAPALGDDRPLRFSVSDSSTMPMVRLAQGKVTAGILHDLHQRIAEKIGRQAEQVVMSRSRIQPLLAEGTVDVSCYVNPAWIDEHRASYRWSVPFMTQRIQLVAAATTPPTTIERLRDERIGTVLGFTYPELEPSFRDATLTRDDARTESQVLAKLAAGRYRYALSSETALGWFNRDRPAERKLRAMDQFVEYSIHCLVRDEPDVPANEILEAMQQLQDDSEFEAILAKYR